MKREKDISTPHRPPDNPVRLYGFAAIPVGCAGLLPGFVLTRKKPAIILVL